MMVSRDSAIAQKRDLHVGGTGLSAAARSLSPSRPFGETWLHEGSRTSKRALDSARKNLQSANQFLRANPVAALGLVAFAGFAAGYFLARRS
jgi:hypothetical protein